MRRKLRNLGSLILVSFAALSGTACDDVFGIDDESDLERAQQRWADEGPASYTFVFGRSCFCGWETTRPARITVVNRVVVSRHYVDTGDPVPQQWERYYPAMEGVFQIVHDAINRDADEVNARYDSRLGYPIDVEIDYVHNAIDDELSLSVTEVRER
jgi:hypothetical protein